MALLARVGWLFPFSEQILTRGCCVYSPKRVTLDVSVINPHSAAGLGMGLMSARNGISCAPEVVSEINLHLDRGVVWHRIEVRIQLRH